MEFNRFTLTFPREEEWLFLKKYLSDSLLQLRIAFILVIALYGTFGYLDVKIVPDQVQAFHAIRYLFVIPILLTVFILSFTKLFQKIWQVLLLISFIVGGVGISIMTIMEPDNSVYYGGMMLVFFAGYFFIKLRFFLATIAGWTILIFFNVGAIFFSHTSEELLLSYNFFFISANIIGMLAAYNIEFYSRRNYFLNIRLEEERLHVLEANKGLEKKVLVRTEELLAAKDQAEESDRLKSAFLANMSHEIRTPMNGILGFANLLKKPNLSDDQLQSYIQIIEQSGARMLNIINDIIDISKIESGITKLELSEVNINNEIEYIYKFFKPDILAKGLKMMYHTPLSSEDAIVYTDRDKFYAILSNLVKNAIKYTDKGAINIGCEKRTDYFEFGVKDSGIGIPEERQEAIFERFIQADISDKMAHQGAGLGLSITQAYVEMLGGEIWVESTEGIGSTFHFTVPHKKPLEKRKELKTALPTANKTELKKDPESNKEPDLKLHNEAGKEDPDRKLKLLIAEDDEMSILLLHKLLESNAQEILEVGNGYEAVESCRNNPDLDLILMDMKMPGLDGFEATREIRKFNKEVVIIAQTAYGLKGDRAKALDAGCNEYISKPIDGDELRSLIQRKLKV